MKWAAGVTTTNVRRHDLLPATLASLAAAGWDRPRLFVDGDDDALSWQREFGLEVTCHYPALRTAGKWVLSLYELYVREPTADLFLLAQDDLVCYRNLRQYLERTHDPTARVYKNCFTFPSNQVLCQDGAVGWFRGREMVGNTPYDTPHGPVVPQTGRGAVALVFAREAVVTLLSARHLVERVQDAHRGYRAVDGGIVTAMNRAGWREVVHNPSLVQHVGLVSSMGNRPHLQATSFRGETFDAMELLQEEAVR